MNADGMQDQNGIAKFGKRESRWWPTKMKWKNKLETPIDKWNIYKNHLNMKSMKNKQPRPK